MEQKGSRSEEKAKGTPGFEEKREKLGGCQGRRPVRNKETEKKKKKEAPKQLGGIGSMARMRFCRSRGTKKKNRRRKFVEEWSR